MMKSFTKVLIASATAFAMMGTLATGASAADLSDTSTLTNAMSNISTTADQSAGTTDAFDTISKALSDTKTAVNTATERLSQAKTRLEALENTPGITPELKTVIQRAEQNIDSHIAALNDANSKLDDVQQKLEKTEQAVQRAQQAIEDAKQVIGKVDSYVQDLEKIFDQIAQGGDTGHHSNQPTGTPIDVYRLYNPNAGVHHYTTSIAERDMLIHAGWNNENTAFKAAKTDATDTNLQPVYREYNPNNGQHNWTLSKGEHDHLVSLGWRNEGIAWYVDPAGQVTVYRMYNPNSGEHLYTTNVNEYVTNAGRGWNPESVAWKGLK
ncbi:glycosyl hydrolase family 25 [Bifidobacterium goeldii]|uniref:Glycosyl hydrolase family 25 n=1 Tax=Bifidobacterium goeldii TaxID=2306975 RepID=A0A430FH13_9BIFI|nr:hypothetical protein [Bifidobacterium goeldii]RSX52117.1 glycosyl hydrolase family 25 [Bifidobacterium goeldii]